MTALRDLSQHAPVPTAGIADKAVTSRKNRLDVQWEQGNNPAYVSIAQGGVINKQPSVPLILTYTPTVPCWWEVVPKVGILSVETGSGAEYRGDLQVRCYRTGPVYAVGMGDHTIMTSSQRVDQARFVGRTCTALFQIEPGYQWVVDIYCIHLSGAAWVYHQSPEYLLLQRQGVGEVTALADLSQQAEIPEAGIGDGAITTPLTVFDTQAVYGAGANTAFLSLPHPVAAIPGVASLALSYTPEVDAFWDVRAHIGYIDKAENSQHYCYFQLACTPAPAVLATARYQIGEQKAASVFTNAHRVCQTLYGLSAGIAYTCQAWLQPGSGGTWRYWHSDTQIHGKAWAR